MSGQVSLSQLHTDSLEENEEGNFETRNIKFRPWPFILKRVEFSEDKGEKKKPYDGIYVLHVFDKEVVSLHKNQDWMVKKMQI